MRGNKILYIVQCQPEAESEALVWAAIIIIIIESYTEYNEKN